MKESEKKYILQTLGKKSIKEIARELGLKERKIRKFLEKDKPAFEKKETIAVFSMFQKNVWAYLLGIVVLGLLVYSNTLHIGFHYDDEFMIVKNTAIRDLWNFKAIADAFNTRFIGGLTFALNYAIGKLNPAGYHVFNVLIHILSAICVFFLVYLTAHTPQMDGSKLKEKTVPVSFLCSLMFLLHPAQSQAVNYIWQRVALLATLFYISAVLFYAQFRLSRKAIFYFISLGCVLAGMFSKETAFTLPFTIALYEFLFFGNYKIETRKKVLVLAPFMLTLLVIPLTLTRAEKITASLMRPQVVTERLLQKDPSLAPRFDMTRWVTEEMMTRREYMLTQLNVFRTYFRLFFWPANQNLDYDYPITKALDAKTLLSIIFFLALLSSSVFFLRRQPAITFGILWICLALSIESIIVQNDVIYEHRIYLPMFGFILAFIIGLNAVIKRRSAFFIAVTAMLVVLSFMTWQRNKVWKDELTLWGDVVKKSPQKARGYYNLALQYEKSLKEDEALKCYLKAVECDKQDAKKKNGRFYPDAVKEFVNVAKIYFQRGEYAKAMSFYEEALNVSLSTNRNPGKIYMNMAITSELMKDEEKAYKFYENAIVVSPQDPDILFTVGTYHLFRGKYKRAAELLERTVEINPSMAAAYAALGDSYLNDGQPEKALKCYEEALKIDPAAETAKRNLNLLRQRGVSMATQ